MRLAICCIALLLTACSSSPRISVDAAGNMERDRVALDKLRADFASAFNATDPVAVANLYSMDAVLMPEGEPTAVGRAAIQQYFQDGFNQFTIKATLTSQEFSFMGTDWAFDRGTYSLTITPKTGGNPTSQQYRYITLLHRESDGWKTKRDIYNSSKP